MTDARTSRAAARRRGDASYLEVFLSSHANDLRQTRRKTRGEKRVDRTSVVPRLRLVSAGRHIEPLARMRTAYTARVHVVQPARAHDRTRRASRIVPNVRPDGGACQETAGAQMNVGRPVYTAITQKLTRALAPSVLVVIDESAMHAGHVADARGRGPLQGRCMRRCRVSTAAAP